MGRVPAPPGPVGGKNRTSLLSRPTASPFATPTSLRYANSREKPHRAEVSALPGASIDALEAEERVALVELGKRRVSRSRRDPLVLGLLMEHARQYGNAAGREIRCSELHGEPDA